ncbi:DUF374 domain-containing protein [Pigmentibacter sp. JX0631]|uniref:lysophospholipid acyltransferase family protein n=1 Tax=Pigmentibacter sp. JX0631 TaxID=2976982 RepID=UPI0024698D4E|nr:DUF374 domain-containing protein [Pigmentibacter sp. JX0631]WGL59795.1 DUF374 domain-containing protein [Pigmentibacter sp. JX0631]
MIKNFMHLRLDSVPWYLKPLILVYGYVLGYLQYIQYWLNNKTIQISWVGIENLSPDKNYIFVFWHRYFPCYFSAFFKFKKHIWMVHPLLYMAHMWILVRLLGVQKIIPGSAGNSGIKATKELIADLTAGYSTMICPDGPSGPPYVFKKGVLYIAAKSKVPIVPLYFRTNPSFQIRSWDKKKFPIPFGKLEVEIGEPIEVSEMNHDTVMNNILSAMNGE